MEDPDSSAARASKIHRLSKSDCTTRVKDIFSVRLTRNGKETMVCSRCFELQEQQRGRDWQLVLTGVTKAKEHVAVYCPGMKAATYSEDARLCHSLLLDMQKPGSALAAEKREPRRLLLNVF